MRGKILSGTGIILFLLTSSSWALDIYRAKEGAVAREKASVDALIIYHFKAGEEFKVIGKEGEWSQVRFNSKATGYVQQTELKLWYRTLFLRLLRRVLPRKLYLLQLRRHLTQKHETRWNMR